MLANCKQHGLSLSGLVMRNELALHSRGEIEHYFADVWQTMRACIDRGMNTEGVLPGRFVPCIERNAIASVKAINATRMAMRRTSEPRVSLDKVIETMYETGKDMNAKYRETSRGGLAGKYSVIDRM